MSLLTKSNSGPTNQLDRKENKETNKTSGGMTHPKPDAPGNYKTFDKNSKLNAMKRRLG